MISLPGHRLLTHSMSFHDSAGSNCARDPGRQRRDVGAARRIAREIAEGLALAARDAERPARLGRDVDHIAQPDFRRHGHAVAGVAMTLAEHLQIDGQDQRAAFGRQCPFDQGFAEAAVLHHIELEPERLVDRAGDVLDRADRHGRERVRDARGLRRAAGENLAVAVLHAGEADRRQRQRHRHRLADDGGGEIALRNVDQHALAQLDALQVGAVRPQRFLRIGSRFGVVEEHLRHLAPGKLAQVFDAMGGAHDRHHNGRVPPGEQLSSRCALYFGRAPVRGDHGRRLQWTTEIGPLRMMRCRRRISTASAGRRRARSSASRTATGRTIRSKRGLEETLPRVRPDQRHPAARSRRRTRSPFVRFRRARRTRCRLRRRRVLSCAPRP